MIVNGARLIADPSGGLYWPAERLLVVADLHFEKGSSYAQRGQLLPPYDTAATLQRLDGLLQAYDAATVICLGDSFHDREAEYRLDAADRQTLCRMAKGRDWIWIAGNHDPEPPGDLGGRIEAEVSVGPLTFRHAPSATPTAGEVAGHLHPKAAVRTRARRVTRRCFASDGLRLVLPAFGAYTGGLDVLDIAFRTVFRGPFSAHLLGRARTYPIPSRRLVPIHAATASNGRSNAVDAQSLPI